MSVRRRACGAYYWFFFFQAEDGIRDKLVTGVQTCALPIFGEHVVHLCDWEHDAGPAPAAGERDARPTVVGYHDTVGVKGVDPNVVVVATRCEPGARERLAAVARHAKAHRHEVEPFFVVGCDRRR